MIKKIFLIILITTMAASLFACGGAGNASLSTPDGVNPLIASRLELMATRYVNQTNSYCYLKAKLIDGNGMPIVGRQVVFTNLSILGILSAKAVNTDTNGIATVTLYSTDSGFSTVQAEVNADGTGTEKIRDKKTVFFTPFDMSWPGSTSSNQASLTLEVDSNNNAVYDESGDFILLDAPGRTDALIRATVYDESGNPLVNGAITFGSDSPDVTFPLGSSETAPIVHTNSDGQATVLARVTPSILRNQETTVNITASAAISSSMTLPAVVTLYLKPVTISSVAISSSTNTVTGGGTIISGTSTTTVLPGTANISAIVTTSVGTPPPLGTNVRFTATRGSIDPFAATDATGIASVTYTAPDNVTAATTAVITASVAGRSGNTTINITAPGSSGGGGGGGGTSLSISVNKSTVIGVLNPDSNTTDDITFTVANGTAPYTISRGSTCSGVIGGPWTLATAGSQLIDPSSVTASATCTLTVVDNLGATAQTSFTVLP